jgi:acyl carrier protein
MQPTPNKTTTQALSRFPAEVLEAFECFRLKGDAAALEALVVAAVVDYRPSRGGFPGPLPDGTRLIEDLGYDSVSVAELVFFLEDLFDVTITNADIQEVRTMGGLRACVIRKLLDKATPA